MENTNYLLDVSCKGLSQHLVLTLFEYLPEESLPFFIHFTDELKADGLPVPSRCGTGTAMPCTLFRANQPDCSFFAGHHINSLILTIASRLEPFWLKFIAQDKNPACNRKISGVLPG